MGPADISVCQNSTFHFPFPSSPSRRNWNLKWKTGVMKRWIPSRMSSWLVRLLRNFLNLKARGKIMANVCMTQALGTKIPTVPSGWTFQLMQSFSEIGSSGMKFNIFGRAREAHWEGFEHLNWIPRWSDPLYWIFTSPIFQWVEVFWKQNLKLSFCLHFAYFDPKFVVLFVNIDLERAINVAKLRFDFNLVRALRKDFWLYEFQARQIELHIFHWNSNWNCSKMNHFDWVVITCIFTFLQTQTLKNSWQNQSK